MKSKVCQFSISPKFSNVCKYLRVVGIEPTLCLHTTDLLQIARSENRSCDFHVRSRLPSQSATLLILLKASEKYDLSILSGRSKMCRMFRLLPRSTRIAIFSAFNSCNFHCWLYDDVFWQQTYWSCYLFDLRFDTTRAGRRARAKQHKNFASTLAALNTATTRRRSRAQNAFLRTLKEFKIVRAPAKQNASEIVKPIDAAQPKEAADRVLVQPTTSETRSSQQPSANEAAQSSHQAPTIASQQQAAAVQKCKKRLRDFAAMLRTFQPPHPARCLEPLQHTRSQFF